MTAIDWFSKGLLQVWGFSVVEEKEDADLEESLR